jgi:DNA mismatch repair protein MutL
LIRETPQVIGQLGNTYILCQVRDGLLMVDQHAAHERIVYENLKKRSNNSRIEAQTLLMPFRLELSTKEQRIVLKKRDQLHRFGLELDHFGGNTFLLRSVPAILKNVQWDAFLSELITELEDDKLDDDIVLDKTLTVMACHGAIRAGHPMTQEEISHLLSELEDMEIPTNCPHGRPIFRHFTYYEIEKMFKRIV